MNFETPHNFLNFGRTSSPRNGIEKHFSINLQMYDEEESFQNSSKAKLIRGGAENSHEFLHQDTNHWYYHTPQADFDYGFNDLDIMGGFYIPPFASTEEEIERGFPSDSKLLKVIHSDSQNSNSESTVDKTPHINETSTTFKRSQGSRIPRRIQQPNRFEKSLDQTLILENEFKKSTNWSKQKMQELAQALDLTVS